MKPARTAAGHVSSDVLALYVIGALEDADQKDAVERHVVGCEVCAEELAREARLEGMLEAVAHRNGQSGNEVAPVVHAVEPIRARHARQHRLAGGIAGALAAAAAIVLVFASISSPRSEPTNVAARGASRDAARELVAGPLADSKLGESGFGESGFEGAVADSSESLDGG